MHILYVGASWCVPCKTFLPVANAMAKEANVIMYYVDAEEEPQRVAGFNVAGLPTLIKIEDGEEVGRVVGANKTAFAKMLKA